MSGPEGRYIAKVNRQVDKLLSPTGFHISNTNPYVGGIPDQYYEDIHGCLWIEYKAVSNFPKVIDLTKTKFLSPLQMAWLKRSQANHGNVAVILGDEAGNGIWFDNLNWLNTQPLAKLRIESPEKIASRIAKHIYE